MPSHGAVAQCTFMLWSNDYFWKTNCRPIYGHGILFRWIDANATQFLSQQDNSVGKYAYHQHWWLEFDPQDPQAGKWELNHVIVHLHTHGVACESAYTCVPPTSPPCHPSPAIVSIYIRWTILMSTDYGEHVLIVMDIWKHINSLCPSFMNVIVFVLSISLAI